MSDIQRQLRQIALRKRDEKGEEGVRVSEKSFVEWQAADEIKRLQKRNALLEDVAVAADKYIWSLKHGKTTEAMNCYCDGLKAALDKLREVYDE
jgi:hypothetical protein